MPRTARSFASSGGRSLAELVEAISGAELEHTRPGRRDFVAVCRSVSPFRRLAVDWWETDRTGAKDLKVWAGTMESYGIARAMQQAMRDPQFRGPGLFDVGMVVRNAGDPDKKKEPYYYDARRAPNAHSRDVGFSTNDLGLESVAHPAVELLCVIGLQVARPAKTDVPRVYRLLHLGRAADAEFIAGRYDRAAAGAGAAAVPVRELVPDRRTQTQGVQVGCFAASNSGGLTDGHADAVRPLPRARRPGGAGDPRTPNAGRGPTGYCSRRRMRLPRAVS